MGGEHEDPLQIGKGGSRLKVTNRGRSRKGNTPDPNVACRPVTHPREAVVEQVVAKQLVERLCPLPFADFQDADQNKKVKNRLTPEGTETWALAGLWEPQMASDGQKGAAFVVLTTAAHPLRSACPRPYAVLDHPRECV